MSRKPKPSASGLAPGMKLLVIAAVIAALAGALHLLNRSGDRREGTVADSTAGPATPDPGTTNAAAATVRPAFQKLLGRWLREDGGYVIEISEVRPDGTLSASYFNPQPIHVSKAAAVEEAGGVKVGIELNDVNYPGCLYTLLLDPALDQLQGTYFQAAMGQEYQVVFVRLPAL